MDYKSWIKETNRVILGAIKDCYINQSKGNWSENFITSKILTDIQGISLDINRGGQLNEVKWDIYKLSGTDETNFGDIMLLVNVRLAEDIFAVGVAYYEAKKRYFDESHNASGFNALKAIQLSTISSKTYASQVVFYDLSTTNCGDGRIMINNIKSNSVQTELVKRLINTKVFKGNSAAIHSYGEPWAVVLGRNLSGIGLDFRQSAVDSVKEAAKWQKPTFIFNAAYSIDNSLEPEFDPYCEEHDGYYKLDSVMSDEDSDRFDLDIGQKPDSNGMKP